MRMIALDRASPDRVPSILDNLCERSGDRLPLRVIKPDWFKVQKRIRIAVELLQFPMRWLDLFTTVMDRSQVGQFLFSNLLRTAPARVVGQPVSVSAEDQMVCDDDTFGWGHNVAKKQASSTVYSLLLSVTIHPLITPIGLKRATLREIPALCSTSTTWWTSL